jgi:hypothetical protein
MLRNYDLARICLPTTGSPGDFSDSFLAILLRLSLTVKEIDGIPGKSLTETYANMHIRASQIERLSRLRELSVKAAFLVLGARSVMLSGTYTLEINRATS